MVMMNLDESLYEVGDKIRDINGTLWTIKSACDCGYDDCGYVKAMSGITRGYPESVDMREITPA